MVVRGKERLWQDCCRTVEVHCGRWKIAEVKEKFRCAVPTHTSPAQQPTAVASLAVDSRRPPIAGEEPPAAIGAQVLQWSYALLRYAAGQIATPSSTWQVATTNVHPPLNLASTGSISTTDHPYHQLVHHQHGQLVRGLVDLALSPMPSLLVLCRGNSRGGAR